MKNLRYAAEFFGGMFASAQGLRAYLRTVAKLQDLLGAHNDTVSARAFLNQVNAAERADTAFAAGLTLGWFAGSASVADHGLMQAWKAFKQAEPFWK